MDLLNALWLSIIEGLTEYIPVSSTGHLILLSEALGLSGEKVKTFEVFIQLGAILAVVVLYPRRFTGLLDFSGGTEGFRGLGGLLRLGVACIPALIIGFLLRDFIKAELFNSTSVGLALITWAVVMVAVEMYKRAFTVQRLEQISLKHALWIGVFQCFSLWPGVSRSGATIVGAMLLGAERRVAAEFSFLVAVPIMTAAVLYDLYKSWTHLDASDATVFTFGFLVAFIVAVAAIKFFIALLNRVSLLPFAVYRVLLGIGVLFV